MKYTKGMYSCSISYHFFTDDSQLHDSTEPILVPCLVQEITRCTDKVSDWMIANKLKMNNEEAEIIPIGTNSKLKQVHVNSIVISGCERFFFPESPKYGSVLRPNNLYRVLHKLSLQDYVP